jgi:hypothetical protein
MSELLTNENTSSENRISLEKKSWISYLSRSANSERDLSHIQKIRYHLTNYFHEIERLSNRSLYHLTLTYKPFKDKLYVPKNTNDFFINFYTKEFLPYLLNTRNYQRGCYREMQPICFAFLDEHENISRSTKQHAKELQTFRFTSRLHHHAIIAVHENTIDKMNTLIGVNKFDGAKFTSKVMTSHVRDCDAMCLLYASKMLYKYPDYLQFPDRLKH